MNIWVEYWKKNNSRSLNNHAQMRENSKWVEPDKKDVFTRYCQSRKEAQELAKRMFEDGYHVTIKTDAIISNTKTFPRN